MLPVQLLKSFNYVLNDYHTFLCCCAVKSLAGWHLTRLGVKLLEIATHSEPFIFLCLITLEPIDLYSCSWHGEKKEKDERRIAPVLCGSTIQSNFRDLLGKKVKWHFCSLGRSEGENGTPCTRVYEKQSNAIPSRSLNHLKMLSTHLESLSSLFIILRRHLLSPKDIHINRGHSVNWFRRL